MRHYYLIISFLFGAFALSAQVILTPLSSPETMVACGGEERYTLSVINSDNVGYGNLILSLQLPVGMEYLAGSVTGPIEEFDLSDITTPQFRFPGLPGLSSFELTFAMIINCSFANDTGVGYSMLINGNEVSGQEQTLANFFFPEVVITDVDFPVLNMAVGSNRERNFTIIQSTPGASLDSVFLVNTYEPGMATLGLNLGEVFGSSPGIDTFLVTGADLPGNDGTFDFGDTLRLTERVRLIDCVSTNSSISLFWRCGEVVCQEFSLNTLLSQATGSPDLRIRNTNGFPNQTTANNPSIVGGGFCDTLELSYLVENLGSEDALGAGAVYDLLLGVGLNNNLFSSSEPFDLGIFPNWEIQVTIAGNNVNLGTYHYPVANPLLGYNLDFSGLSSDPDGAGGLTDLDEDGFFDDLPVGNSLTFTVHIIYDPDATTDCAFLSGFPYNGGAETNLRIGYYYRDQCEAINSYWYSVNDPGINVISLFTHRNVTYTIELEENNLNPGQVTTMEIRPDGAWNSPCGATDSFVLEIILPDGLVAAPNAYGPGNFSGIVGQSGDTVWLASNERGTFTQPWGLDVSLDCGEAIQDTTVNVSFLYFCAPDCGPAQRIDCQEIVIDYLPQCEVCEEGIETRNFMVERLNYGWTNANHNQVTDPTIDPTINLSAAINNDSVGLQLQGVFRGNGPYDGLYARITHQGLNAAFAAPNLPHFNAIGAQLDYYAADGTYFSCEDIAPTINWSYFPPNNEHLLLADLEAYFQPGGCLETVDRMAGDSIVYTIYSLVTANTPRRALPLPELTGQFFLLQNGVETTCNYYLDNFVLEEVIPNTSLAYATQEHYGCAEIYFNNNSIANPGHIYDADQFPNEVRSIVDVSEVRIRLEGDWHHQAGSSDLLANGSFDENDAVSVTAPYVIVPIPDPLVSFDGTFTTFIYQNDGSWPQGDLVIGGSNPVHNIRFRAVPGCTVPRAVPFVMEMEADMIRYLNAPLDLRDTITSMSTSANKTILKPSAELLPASPQEFIPNSDTIIWVIDVNNTTSYGNADKLIRHAWLAIETDPSLSIFAIEEISSPGPPVALPILTYSDGSNFWAQLGEVPGFATRSFRVRGIYQDCERQELRALLGYSCSDYPNPDPRTGYQLAGTTYQCPVDTLVLAIQPTPVSLSLEVEGPPLPAPLCEALDYSVLVSNLQLPTAYNSQLTTSLPFGAQVVAGSSQIEIPANSGNWLPLADPLAQSSNEWLWPLATQTNGIVQLLGVNRAPDNSYRLAFKLLTLCGLNAGLRIGFEVEATNSCGQLENRKAFSEKLLIEGLPDIINTYAVFLDAMNADLQACDSSLVSGKLINLGPLPSSTIEYALVSIPAAFEVLPATLSGPSTFGNTQQIADRQLIQLQMPNGVLVGDSIAFSFQVQDTRQSELNCEEAQISISAVVESQVNCMLAQGDSCNVLFVLNSDTVTVDIRKDQLSFDLLDHQSVNTANIGETMSTRLRINNLDTRAARTDTIIWEIYRDLNNDGTIDPASEPLVFSSDERPIHILPQGNWIDEISYLLPTDQVCQLLITFRNTGYSCQCASSDTLTLPVPQLKNAGTDGFICSGDTLLLGSDERVDNISFQWLALPGSDIDNLLSAESAFAPFTSINTSLSSQVYSFVLETNRGPFCLSQDTVNVEVYPALQASTVVTSDYNGQDISCAGANDGRLRVNVELATEPIYYQLLNETPITDPLFVDLAQGVYTFLITDANGCQVNTEGLLTQPLPLALDVHTTAVNCSGGTDGQIVLTPAGGTPDYAYQWSVDAANSPIVGSLPAGEYQVTLTDANACTWLQDSIIVTEATPIEYSFSIDSTSCSYSSDGLAVIDTILGGQGPYTVSWEDGSSLRENANLPIGMTSVQIMDDANCLVDFPLTIPGPAILSITDVQQLNTSCFGFADGSLALSVVGGTAPYQYSWNNGTINVTNSNLAAGSYQVNIRDTNDCLLSSPTYIITEPAAIQVASLETEDVSCFGYADGAISITASGGTAPYRYNWAIGSMQPSLENLLVGNYPVEIRDANDCLLTTAFNINQPTALLSTYEPIAPPCFGDESYFIFSPSGGTPDYVFSVDGGETFTPDVRQLVSPGIYDLVVADANDCRFQLEGEIAEPLPIIINAPEQIIINYGDSLPIHIYVDNIRGDSIIRWLPFDDQLSCHNCLDPILRAQETTIYTLRIGDSFNCFEEVRIPVIVERPRRFYLPNAFSPNGEGDNEVFFPYGANEVERVLRLEIYNRWGNQVFAQRDFPANDPSFGWNGTFNGEALPPAVYVYQIEVLYTDGTVLWYGGDIVLVR